MRGTNFAALLPPPADRRAPPIDRDALTGLPNRALFATVLRDACTSDDRDGMALLRVSLSDIGTLRDDHGLATADALIAAVAGRLHRSIRTGDVAARLRDGDFALILAAEDVVEAACAAQRVLDRLREPFEVSGAVVELRVSIGIAHVPPVTIDPDILLERSEIALARALAIGGSVFKIFKPRHAVDPRLREALLTDLREAVATGTLGVSFRPNLHVETLRLASADAVLRWDHPMIGLIDSSDFLPVMGNVEASQLLLEWGFERLCRIVAQAGITCPVILPVESGGLDADLVDRLADIAASSRGAAERVSIGIPEAEFRDLGSDVMSALGRLREAGCGVVLDEYAGHLIPQNMIRSLPVGAVRTGATLLAELDSDVTAFARLQALTGLASSLGIAIGAKGVESGEQLERLLGFGFSEVQGALFGETLTADELAAHARHDVPFLPRGDVD